jgi:hypothetical protein
LLIPSMCTKPYAPYGLVMLCIVFVDFPSSPGE